MEYDISYLLKKLILPIIGIPDDGIAFAIKNFREYTCDNDKKNNIFKSGKRVQLIRKNKYLFRFSYREKDGLSTNHLFSISFNNPMNKDMIYFFSCLLDSFERYSNFANETSSRLIQEKTNELILQKGIFNYIFQNNELGDDALDNLYKCLVNWSLKTYEGHNVCFGFLVDLNKILPDDSLDEICGSFIDFVSEEYSAVFTDGISSIVEISKNCKFIAYHSLLDNDVFEECDIKSRNLPVRFSQIITKYVTGNKVGLFLLNNGDLIISKKQEIKFIKRAGHWVNFSKKRFISAIQNKIKKIKVPMEVYKSVYCTMLDISLSHTGGLIALVNDERIDWKTSISKQSNPLISKVDLLQRYYDENNKLDLSKYIKQLYDDEIERLERKSNSKLSEGIEIETKKRLNKLRFIITLLNDKRNFQLIDRKLRAELSGLDGAFVINQNGEILACGAIIANTAGSSGGGRGSAARTLSRYGGFAIKISTDGYVEVYMNENRIYAIK